MRKMLKRGVGIVLAAALAIAPLPTFRAAQAFAAEGISFTEVGGYAEGAYAEFTTGLSAKGYNAYVKKSSQADSAYVKPSRIFSMRRRKSSTSLERQRMAIISEAGVISKPDSCVMPFDLGPSPTTMLRNERSFTSSTRRQRISFNPKPFA